jgi:hypothetical protein
MEKKEIKCTLTDKELIKEAKKQLSKLCETGGRSFTMRVPVDHNKDTDTIIGEVIWRFERVLRRQKVDFNNTALPIRDINGCWVFSNDERPIKDGIYTTIDSHGIESETLFDNKHWIIRQDGHPVQMWLKPNCN